MSYCLLRELWRLKKNYCGDTPCGIHPSSKLPNIREEKQHEHKLFGPDVPRTFLTLTRGCPWVKSFILSQGRIKMHFGADVHDFRRGRSWPEGFSRTLERNVCIDFLAPNEEWLRASFEYPLPRCVSELAERNSEHSFSRPELAGVLRGMIRGNKTRNTERKMALWEGLWEGIWKTSENL